MRYVSSGPQSLGIALAAGSTELGTTRCHDPDDLARPLRCAALPFDQRSEAKQEIASLRQVIKNLSMPLWGLNRFWRSRQVFPESFHGSEFFLNRHFV